ncbi:MAG: restriction endonuclease subunit S [Proteobacteria bacterium]|nr:restriction endonuclease subunit S [Pseudomonadota bacterium]
MMGGKYQTYPRYKDSGVVWLGGVPENWTVTKIGYLSHKTGSGKTPKGGSEIYSDSGILFLRSQNVYDTGLLLNENDVVFISEKIDEEMTGSRVLNGDILLNITGASIGRTCIVPEGFQPANVNQHVCIIRTPSTLRKYLSLYLKSASTKAQIDAAQNGAAREGLNFEQLSNIAVCFPDNELERDAIADFLDHETAKIDTLIEKQQQLIKLLKEKRQAVISHAVTKGLNPNAPMRNSGVEWLGEVPEHWVVLRLSRVGKIGQGCSFAHAIQGQEAGELPWFKCMDMNSPGNDENMNKAANYVDYDLAEKIRAPIFPAGTVIFPRVGAALLTNKRRILSRPSIVDDNIYTFTPTRIQSRFAYIFLQLIDMGALCSPGLVPTITFGAINNVRIPLPSFSEQQEIVDHVDSHVIKMETLIQKAEIMIGLMQERRTALISAAVTGKIDVRHFNPEDGESPEPSNTNNKEVAA